MKKLPIEKKTLNDFSKFKIKLSQQKQLKGGEDETVPPPPSDIITDDFNL